MCVLYSFSMLGSLQKNIQSKVVSGEVRAATLCWARLTPWQAGECGITFNVAVNYAVLVEDVDGHGDLLRIQPDDVFLEPQPRHLFQRALVTVLHEDVHLLLREEPHRAHVHLGAGCRAWNTPLATPPRTLPSKGQLHWSSSSLNSSQNGHF